MGIEALAQSGVARRYFAGPVYLPLPVLEQPHHLVDSGLEFAVEPLQLVLGRVLRPHVRIHAVVLEVDAVVVRLRRVVGHHQRARGADAAAIDQAVAPRRNHGRRRRVADDAAEAELAEAERRHLAVGSRSEVDQHDLRPGDRLPRPPAPGPRAPPVVPGPGTAAAPGCRAAPGRCSRRRCTGYRR